MTPDPPLIPRTVLFSNPDRAAPRLSSGGRFLAFLGDTGGALNLWLAPRERPAEARPVTHFSRRGIHHYQWAYDDRTILYLRDTDGDENWHVIALDVVTEAERDLTPYPGVSARVVRLSPGLPGRALVAMNDRSPALHDLYAVDLTTGQRTLLDQNAGFLGYVADLGLTPRFALRLTATGAEYLRRGPGGEWESFLTIPAEDQLTTVVEGFDASGDAIYLRDSRGRDTAALTRVSLTDGTATVIAEDPRCDLGAVLFHPVTGALQAVSFDHDRPAWRFFDEDVRRAFDELRALDGGEPSVVGRTIDDAHWVVASQHDDRPAAFYLYDRQRRAAEFLFTSFARLVGIPLARLHPVVIRSRDGLDLVSYLQLPRAADPGATGRPAAPLPLVVLVHGGPWGRDAWGFNPSSQWLADRGYATLSVNFRGSTGFGKAFLNAGNREWGARMQDDLDDAVAWAVREGIADPGRVALVGNSYGGYAAVMGLARTPDRYAAAVAVSGPSNLVSFLQSAPAYWKPMQELLIARVGDFTTEEGRSFLRERSPLTHADRITRPLLVAHGDRDPRIPRAEADQLVEALEARGVPVVYLVFPDEGHLILRPANGQAFCAVAEAFLARTLGGRWEPPGDALAGSSVEVRAGSQFLGPDLDSPR